jgi:hypothetical protein
MKQAIFFLLLCLLALGSSAQDNLIFTKKNFADVVQPADEAETIGTTSTVWCRSDKYRGLYSLFGNLNKVNKDVAIGDFKVTYTYTTKTSKDNTALGLSYVTFNEPSSEFFMFSYMLTPSGDLKFFSGKGLKYFQPVPEKEFVSEPCAAVKTGGLPNTVSVERKGRQWTLVVNDQVVKQLQEPEYVKAPKSGSVAPLDRFTSNVLLVKGKQELEFKNCIQSFYALASDYNKDVEDLASVAGHYRLEPKCTEGGTNIIFDVEVRYFREGFHHKVNIAGINDKDKNFYLVKDDNNGRWYCNLDNNDVFVFKGKTYRIGKIYFNPGYSRPQLSVNMSRSSFEGSTEQRFSCVFEGSRL